jgi:hypothetical protein
MNIRLLWTLSATLFGLMFVIGLMSGDVLVFRVAARVCGVSAIFITLLLWFPAWRFQAEVDKKGGLNQLLYYMVMIFWFPVGSFFIWWFLGDRGRRTP